MEASAVDVAHREMGEPRLPGRPRRAPLRHLRSQGRAEEGELKTEAPALFGCEIAGVIPPFGAEVGMRAVVGRKGKRPRLQSPGVAAVVRGPQDPGDGKGGGG